MSNTSTRHAGKSATFNRDRSESVQKLLDRVAKLEKLYEDQLRKTDGLLAKEQLVKMVDERDQRIAELERRLKRQHKLLVWASAMLRSYTNYPAGSPSEFIDWLEDWRKLRIQDSLQHSEGAT